MLVLCAFVWKGWSNVAWGMDNAPHWAYSSNRRWTCETEAACHRTTGADRWFWGTLHLRRSGSDTRCVLTAKPSMAVGIGCRARHRGNRDCCAWISSWCWILGACPYPIGACRISLCLSRWWTSSETWSRKCVGISRERLCGVATIWTLATRWVRKGFGCPCGSCSYVYRFPSYAPDWCCFFAGGCTKPRHFRRRDYCL